MFIYELFLQSFTMFVRRVSRRANADPLIQELNVGDAAEPQGRGTGQPSLNPEQNTGEHTLIRPILKMVEPNVNM